MEEETKQQNQRKILIVEDEKPMARILEVKLKNQGFDAHAVFSGEEGLTELLTGTYDLVLLDIMMPGVDGWKILSEAKEKNISTKILVTSNLSQEQDIAEAKKLGAVGFIVKSNTTLAGIVEEVLSVLS